MSGRRDERASDGPDDRRAVTVRVTGTVQGVGFRPFVARTATANGLAGTVRNTDGAVTVRFEGPPAAVTRAVETVRTDPPPLASVASVTVRDRDPTGREGFEIVESTDGDDRAALVPPDTGLCENCRGDVHDPDSRYHGYWATACVDCGPRFTITEGLPYDRSRTAMAPFPPCRDCRSAYETRTDRRFHAQTVACPDCGPSLTLLDGEGVERATGAGAIDALAGRLRDGETVAVKSAGGAHLCCPAREPEAVARLRERTGRPSKPFAVMVPSVDRVASFAHLSDAERTTLTDGRRPIVLLERADASGGDERTDWLEAVAPGLHTVGVMLPYSGLHHLLFDRYDDPVVATSANRPGEPMCTTREDLLALAAPDAVVVHDREVVNRCDDSVVRHVDGDRRFLRRSRGWVPDPLPRPRSATTDATVLAVGGRSDVTVAVADDDRVVPSQHVGDVTDPATEQFHDMAADHLLDLLDASPDAIAHDRHPSFRTTAAAQRRAEATNARTIPVQHHHAHAAGLLAETGRDRAIVVAADGTGYGPDGVVRGGEVLASTLADSDRVGGVSEFRLPGGERAVERPARTLGALLPDARAVDHLRSHGFDAAEASVVCEQAERGVNSPPTTSAGRFLDAVAALVGAASERTYRGEPALRLEALATRGEPVAVDPPVDWAGPEPVFRADRAVERLADLAAERPAADVAATAQRLLADGLAAIAVDAARNRGVDAVGFTGGVVFNDAVSRRLRTVVEAADLTFLGHETVPPGDAGLAYGQAVAASARLADR
jgi:hydrogenase maturation protein HypF